MKNIRHLCAIGPLIFLCGTGCTTINKTELPPIIENEPELKLEVAIQVAQSFLEKSGVETTHHYLDNVRLIYSSSWMEGKHWILTWNRSGPRPVMGGQIFVFVDMNGNTKKMGGI